MISMAQRLLEKVQAFDAEWGALALLQAPAARCLVRCLVRWPMQGASAARILGKANGMRFLCKKVWRLRGVGWVGGNPYEARSCNAAAGAWPWWVDAMLSSSSRALLWSSPGGVGKLAPAQLLLGWSTRLPRPCKHGFRRKCFDDDMTSAGATCAQQQPQVAREVLNRRCAGAGMPAGKRIEIIILLSITASGEQPLCYSLCHLFFGNSPWSYAALLWLA